MIQCPHCNAPEGSLHATRCPFNDRPIVNGDSSDKITAILYRDSKNKRSFEQAMEYQDFVVEQMNKLGFYIQLHSSKRYQFDKGESVQRCEIKLDNLCTKTGRLSIEVGERTSLESPWVESGIYRSDGTVFYVQGNWERLFLFAKKMLVAYHANVIRGAYEESPRESPTVRKFYLPLPDAEAMAILMI